MLNHIEQLIALISLQYNLECERLDEQPDYIESHSDKTKFHKEMEDGINLQVVVDEDAELFYVYTDEGTALVTLQFDDFELAYEELEIYADEVVYA